MTRAVTVLLWVVVTAGPVLGGMALFGKAPADPMSAGAVDDGGVEQRSGVGPSDFAVRFVRTWLAGVEGDEPMLTEFVPQVPALPPEQLVRLGSGGLRAAATEEVSPGYWAVTVAGDVGRASEPGSSDHNGSKWRGSTRFWRIGVVAHGGSAAGGSGPDQLDGSDGAHSGAAAYVATGLPVEVPGPIRAEAAPLAYGAPFDGAPGRLGEAVLSFVRLYLAGGADLERFVAPGATVRRPGGRYSDVELLSVAAATVGGARVDLRELDERVPRDGQRLAVLATVQPYTSAGMAPVQQIALEVRARAGRWEITGLDPAPALAHDDDQDGGESR